jgi:hypothetical protein
MYLKLPSEYGRLPNTPIYPVKTIIRPTIDVLIIHNNIYKCKLYYSIVLKPYFQYFPIILPKSIRISTEKYLIELIPNLNNIYGITNTIKVITRQPL